MHRLILSLIFACSPLPVTAQDWALRDGDRRLDRAALEGVTQGKPLVFYDDGQSRFFATGVYTYTYANAGGTAYGVYELKNDGRICIAFRNGFGRCDLYVLNEGRLVLLTECGERYPVRP